MIKWRNHRNRWRGLRPRSRMVPKDRRLLLMLSKLRKDQDLRVDSASEVRSKQINNRKTESLHSSKKGEATMPTSNHFWIWKICKANFRSIHLSWGLRIYSKYYMPFWGKCSWLKLIQLIIWCMIWRRSFRIIITSSMIITSILQKDQKKVLNIQRCPNSITQNETPVQQIHQEETRNKGFK